MEYNLDDYAQDYTPKWVMDAITTNSKSVAGKKQWYVAGFRLGSVENIPTVQKYARSRIHQALNSEDNFGEMIKLRDKWAKGKVKECMDEEIKEGTYSLGRCIEYTSKKGFTGFYDKNDPTFQLRIPAEKLENICVLSMLGATPKIIYDAMELLCSLEELEEYIILNREGELDNSFKFIANKSRTDEGFIDYVRDEVEPLKDKHLLDFKIREEE